MPVEVPWSRTVFIMQFKGEKQEILTFEQLKPANVWWL